MVRISNLLILLVFAFAICVAGPSFAATKKKKASSSVNEKYASIVIDSETGAILSQSNPDKLLHPASLTKMMTLLLTFEALEKGTLRPQDRITVSKRAAGMSPSKLGLAAGSSIRVQDAIYAVVTKSANDISVALAEAVGGSEAGFVRMMNARAHSIGMNRTLFRNASGLPDARQVSTARDMAKLARYIITQHASYYPVFNKRTFTYNGHTYRNHNRLLDSYPGLDGMKTGFVNASGFNLVASAKRDGKRIIGVVFGGKTTQSRNIHMAGLLDTGFAEIDKVRIAQARPPVIRASVPAAAGQTQTAQLVVDTSETQISGNTLTAADRLMQTAPQVSSFGQTGKKQKLQTLGTVRLASLETANDAAPAQAAAPVTPLYTPQQKAAVPAMQSGYATQNTWAIQVGAFQSRVATDQAIYKAMQTLPAELSPYAQAMIVPLRTADATWVFRARLAGFNQQQAEQACRQIKDCITISPQAY